MHLRCLCFNIIDTYAVVDWLICTVVAGKIPPLQQNPLGPVLNKRITKFYSCTVDTGCICMSGSPVMSNWMQVNLLRNRRNRKGIMLTAVIGLCAWEQK